MTDSNHPAMTPLKPHLVRATYEWLAENNKLPYLTLLTGVKGVKVPPQFYAKPTLTLNISMTATAQLELGNDAVTFRARFSQVEHSLYIPMEAIAALYAADDPTAGMIFANIPEASTQENSSETASPPSVEAVKKPTKAPWLRVVK